MLNLSSLQLVVEKQCRIAREIKKLPAKEK
jgi:hypothetical protein